MTNEAAGEQEEWRKLTSPDGTAYVFYGDFAAREVVAVATTEAFADRILSDHAQARKLRIGEKAWVYWADTAAMMRRVITALTDELEESRVKGFSLPDAGHRDTEAFTALAAFDLMGAGYSSKPESRIAAEEATDG